LRLDQPVNDARLAFLTAVDEAIRAHPERWSRTAIVVAVQLEPVPKGIDLHALLDYIEEAIRRLQ
jgi:hypothetical protein